MGQEKSTQHQDQTQQFTATPEENQLNKLQLGQAQAFDPMQRQLNQSGGDLINKLLTGQGLPGFLGQLPGGIDQGVTQGIVDDSLKDLYPQFQANGILDSGVAAQIAGRTSADVRQNSAQFNLQNLQQLLSMAIGGQSSVQQPAQQASGQVGQRLAGLRGVNATGTTSTYGMNPFLKSFQTQLGSTLGQNIGNYAKKSSMGQFGGQG